MTGLAPPMLRAIADDISYPGNDEFPTKEAWHDYLYGLAARFENCTDDYKYRTNPYDCATEYEKWSEWINAAENGRSQILKDALHEFSRMEVFNNLWT